MIKKEHKTTPHEEGPARRKPSSHRGGGRRAHRRTFQKERERERFFKIARFSLSLVSSFSSSLSYFGAYFLLLFRFFLVKNVCLRGPSLHQKERERERERERDSIASIASVPSVALQEEEEEEDVVVVVVRSSRRKKRKGQSDFERKLNNTRRERCVNEHERTDDVRAHRAAEQQQQQRHHFE